jgi:hypothetical protein
MNTKQAEKYIDSHSDLFVDMAQEFEDLYDLAEEIEAFFLGNFDMLGKNDYPDFEDLAMYVIENYVA